MSSNKAPGVVIAAAAAGIGGVVSHEAGLFAEIGSQFGNAARHADAGLVNNFGEVAGSNFTHGIDAASVGHAGTIADSLLNGSSPSGHIVMPPARAGVDVMLHTKPSGGLTSGLYDQTTQSSQAGVTDKITADAAPKVASDLEKYRNSMTIAQVSDVLQRDLASSAETVAEKKNSGLKFEAFSGKLKMEKSMNIGGLALSGGEVNVYKVSTVAVGGVMACRGLNAASFDTCIVNALAKVGKEMADIKDAKSEAPPRTGLKDPMDP